MALGSAARAKLCHIGALWVDEWSGSLSARDNIIAYALKKERYTVKNTPTILMENVFDKKSTMIIMMMLLFLLLIIINHINNKTIK